MGMKVCKFGGTSLADANQIRKVQAIIAADPARRYVVPSAPGKRTSKDQKITDLLYLCHSHASQRLPFDDVWKVVADRYRQIAADLGVTLDLELELATVKATIASHDNGTPPDYAASRGEYLNGLIIAALLGWEFIDATEVIFFDARGRLDMNRTQQVLSARLKKTSHAVVPGFYGSTPDGQVKTFSRGGSDISGAIVAAGAGASVYENWTDVSGLLMSDPRIVDNPRPIDVVTYRELRELAYMGASVLHDEAIFPVRKAGIPVNIRNTNRPDDAGTLITPEASPIAHKGTITGIAGRKDFTVITLYKAMMNAEVGFGRRLLGALEDHGVSFEHTPTGIDTMSVVVQSASLTDKMEKVLEQIRVDCEPDTLEVYPDLALVAVVGRGMVHTPGTAAKVFGALAQASVNIRMIDQGSSEINIIVGVDSKDFENAMRAIYAAFVN
ncbi:MAG: aspartate kinase [Phycisphaeraceae bacterium]